MSQKKSSFFSKCKIFLNCFPVRDRNEDRLYHKGTLRYTFYDLQNIMGPQSSRYDPLTDAAPMYQPDIPPKNRNFVKEYLQPTNHSEAMGQPLEKEEEDPEYAEIGPVNSTSFNSETEDNCQTLACNSQNGQQALNKQDSCIFGGFVVSHFELQKCIKFLSEIRQACEIKINRQMETSQNLDEDVEEKIKFCIETLKSFDLHYFEKFELSSYTSSDEGLEKQRLRKNIRMMENKLSAKSATPLESSEINNMSASYYEMDIMKKKKDQHYMQFSVSNNHYEDCDVPSEKHYETINPAPLQNAEVENSNYIDSEKGADDVSTHAYENISTLCLEQPKTDDIKSFKDKKMNYPSTSQEHYYANLPSNEDPIQKLLLENLIGKKSNPLPLKEHKGNTDSAQMITEDLQNVNGGLDECYANTALVFRPFYAFYKDDEVEEFNPLIHVTHRERYKMVANWVMTVDASLGVEENEIAPEGGYAEGFELKDKEEGPKGGKKKLTVLTTAL